MTSLFVLIAAGVAVLLTAALVRNKSANCPSTAPAEPGDPTGDSQDRHR